MRLINQADKDLTNLLKEKFILAKKIDKLYLYIKTGDIPKYISSFEFSLMIEQFEAMKIYYETLDERIDYLKAYVETH